MDQRPSASATSRVSASRSRLLLFLVALAQHASYHVRAQAWHSMQLVSAVPPAPQHQQAHI